jgi:hypothetical protein
MYFFKKGERGMGMACGQVRHTKFIHSYCSSENLEINHGSQNVF